MMYDALFKNSEWYFKHLCHREQTGMLIKEHKSYLKFPQIRCQIAFCKFELRSFLKFNKNHLFKIIFIVIVKHGKFTLFYIKSKIKKKSFLLEFLFHYMIIILYSFFLYEVLKKHLSKLGSCTSILIFLYKQHFSIYYLIYFIINM